MSTKKKRIPEDADALTTAQEAEIARIEAGGDVFEGAEPVDLRVRKPLAKVVPLRLNADHWATLAREAEELGTRPTTLLRMWVLERLREVRTRQGAVSSAVIRPARAGEASAAAARRSEITVSGA